MVKVGLSISSRLFENLEEKPDTVSYCESNLHIKDQLKSTFTGTVKNMP